MSFLLVWVSGVFDPCGWPSVSHLMILTEVTSPCAQSKCGSSEALFSAKETCIFVCETRLEDVVQQVLNVGA